MWEHQCTLKVLPGKECQSTPLDFLNEQENPIGSAVIGEVVLFMGPVNLGIQGPGFGKLFDWFVT